MKIFRVLYRVEIDATVDIAAGSAEEASSKFYDIRPASLVDLHTSECNCEVMGVEEVKA